MKNRADKNNTLISKIDKTKEKVNLMIATEHSVYSISSDVHEEPVLMYNTTHVIKGKHVSTRVLGT